MKTSVLVSTYNGEAFVEEQLSSILNQSVRPDEVLIRDDCSTDCTAELIQSFIAENSLGNWRLVVNDCNQGYRKNFRALAEAAAGDIVFFCDQDDVWGRHKIESCVDYMNDFPDVNLVCTDYIASGNRADADSLDDATLRNGWNAERVPPHRGKPYVWLGCAMAVRSSFIRDILPYWPDDWAHDECVWCMAEAFGASAILHESHLWHRVHGGNATGKKVHDRARRLALVEEKAKGYAEVVKLCEDKGIAGRALRLFKGMKDCQQARASFLKKPTVGKAGLLVRNLGYYPEAKSYLVDVAIAFGMV